MNNVNTQQKKNGDSSPKYALVGLVFALIFSLTIWAVILYFIFK